MSSFYWTLFTGHYRWLLRFNGERDYPHLLALLVIGFSFYSNILTLVLLAVSVTEWQPGDPGESGKLGAVALIIGIVGALASYTLREQRYRVAISSQDEATSKRNQIVALTYTLASIAALFATIAALAARNAA